MERNNHMKITDMTNLWMAYNEEEDFTVVICANEEREAQEIADEYCEDAGLQGKFIVGDFDMDTCIDCDYILTE
jgi:hypothetical protein